MAWGGHLTDPMLCNMRTRGSSVCGYCSSLLVQLAFGAPTVRRDSLSPSLFTLPLGPHAGVMGDVCCTTPLGPTVERPACRGRRPGAQA